MIDLKLRKISKLANPTETLIEKKYMKSTMFAGRQYIYPRYDDGFAKRRCPSIFGNQIEEIDYFLTTLCQIGSFAIRKTNGDVLCVPSYVDKGEGQVAVCKSKVLKTAFQKAKENQLTYCGRVENPEIFDFDMFDDKEKGIIFEGFYHIFTGRLVLFLIKGNKYESNRYKRCNKTLLDS